MLLVVYGTEWPILCWCAVKKLLSHSPIADVLCVMSEWLMWTAPGRSRQLRRCGSTEAIFPTRRFLASVCPSTPTTSTPPVLQCYHAVYAVLHARDLVGWLFQAVDVVLRAKDRVGWLLHVVAAVHHARDPAEWLFQPVGAVLHAKDLAGWLDHPVAVDLRVRGCVSERRRHRRRHHHAGCSTAETCCNNDWPKPRSSDTWSRPSRRRIANRADRPSRSQSRNRRRRRQESRRRVLHERLRWLYRETKDV